MIKPRHSKAILAIGGALLTAAGGVATNRVQGRWWLQLVYFAAAVALLTIAALALRPGSDSESSQKRRAKKAHRTLIKRVLPSYYHQLQEVTVGQSSVGAIDVPTAYAPIHYGVRLAANFQMRHADDDGPGISDAYDQSGGFLLVLGQAGSGKTHSLASLLLQLLARSAEDRSQPIPFYIHASKWDGNKSNFGRWCVQRISSEYGPSEECVSRWIEDSDITLVIDGLDELTRKVRLDCLTAINRFRHTHGLVSIVVACREQEYIDSSKQLQLSGCLRLKPVNVKNVLSMLATVDKEGDGLLHKAKVDRKFRDLLCIPLFLKLAVHAYQNLPAVQIVNDSGSWQNSVIDAYLSQAGRRISNADNATGLGKWLSVLAENLRARHQTIFYPDRLPIILVTEHQKSLREAGIRQAGFATGGVMAIALLAIRVPLLDDILKNSLFIAYAAPSVLLIAVLTFTAWKLGRHAIESPLGGRRSNVRRIIWRIGLNWILAYVCLSSLLSALSHFVPGQEFSILLLLSSIGVGMYPAWALTRSSTKDIEATPRYPGEENKSLVVTCAISVVAGAGALGITLFIALSPFGFADPSIFPLPIWAIMIYFVIPYSLAIGMRNGGAEVIARYASERLAISHGLLPRPYMATFDALRKSSILVPRQGGYEFIHTLVRDRLAERK
jgi:cadmium resistance protein CadD (predicted permease)